MSALPPKPDDLDRTLSAFFKDQVPNPLPPCRAVQTAEPASSRRSVGGRHQLALAASVAALLGLGLFVSSGGKGPQAAKAPTPADATGLIHGATASGSELLKNLKSDEKGR